MLTDRFASLNIRFPDNPTWRIEKIMIYFVERCLQKRADTLDITTNDITAEQEIRRILFPKSLMKNPGCPSAFQKDID